MSIASLKKVLGTVMAHYNSTQTLAGSKVGRAVWEALVENSNQDGPCQTLDYNMRLIKFDPLHP